MVCPYIGLSTQLYSFMSMMASFGYNIVFFVYNLYRVITVNIKFYLGEKLIENDLSSIIELFEDLYLNMNEKRRFYMNILMKNYFQKNKNILFKIFLLVYIIIIKMANHDFECIKGSRAKVMNGTCRETTGGLKKKDLKYNDNGKIVSKRASEKARLNKNLGVFQKKKGFKWFCFNS